MRIVKTGKNIMNLTEEEANKLMKMVYKTLRNKEDIPKVYSIEIFDEEDRSVIVIYKDEQSIYKYIFMEDEIYKLGTEGSVPSKIKIEFLVNHGYLKIEE